MFWLSAFLYSWLDLYQKSQLRFSAVRQNHGISLAKTASTEWVGILAYLYKWSNRIIQVAFWQFFGTINIISDVCLIVLPLYILLGLQLNLSKKIVMLSCFGARVMYAAFPSGQQAIHADLSSRDIIATGIQLAFVSTINSVDPTRDISTWLLMTQVIQCITIVTSCIPYLRPLLQSYPSGLFLSDEIRRKQSRITYSTNGGSRDITALRGTGKKSTRLTSQKLPSATLSEQLKDDRASYHSEQYMLGRSGSIGASTPTDGDLSTAEAK